MITKGFQGGVYCSIFQDAELGITTDNQLILRKRVGNDSYDVIVIGPATTSIIARLQYAASGMTPFVSG